MSSRLAKYIIYIIHVQLTLYVRLTFFRSPTNFQCHFILCPIQNKLNLRDISWLQKHDNVHYKDIYIYIVYIRIYTPRVERRDLFHSRRDVNLEEHRIYFLRRDRIFTYGKLKIYGQFKVHEVSKISKLISLRIQVIFNSGNK